MTRVITLGTIGENLRRQIESGSIHLLSELNLEQEEVEIIRSNADRLIQHALSGRQTFDIQTAYFMMDVGMRFYNEGTYWTDFWDQTGKPNPNHQSKLGEFFVKTIDRYNLATAETRGRKYVNPIMMHAFVPEKYCDYFFDYVKKYFTIVLKNTFPEDFDQELSVFEEVFRDSDPTGSYPEFKYVNLLVPTKLALTDRKYYAPILSKIIRRISNDYDSEDDVKLGVYEEPFRKWKLKEEGRKNKHSDVSSPPTISYDLSKNELYLLIPPQILDPSDGMKCTVRSSEGSILKEFNIAAYSQFHKMISDQKGFKLNWNPLDEFVISIGERVLYTNKNDGVIFFNKNGQKKSKVSLGFNMAILPKEGEIDVMTSELGEGNGYVIKGFLMTRGGKICVSGRTYIIEEEIQEHLNVISDSLDLDCTDQDGNTYKVFSHHPTISISHSQNKMSKLKLSIGRRADRLSYDTMEDIASDEDIQFDRDSNYVLDISKKNLTCENGIYTVRHRGRDVFRYVLLNGFTYHFERDLYEKDEESKLYYTDNQEGQPFNTTQGVVSLPAMNMDGRELTIVIQVPSRRFSFDTKKWMLFDSKELYFRDIEQKRLYIYCPTLVFPQILAIYPKATPQPLEIQGPHLTCEFKKVTLVGNQLNAARMYMPLMRFKCGRFNLFTIRYTADYEFFPWKIIRKNAPINTNAVCVCENGQRISFLNDTAHIPPDVSGIIDVYEYYDDGFGEQKRFARSIHAEMKLEAKPEAIINGVTPDSITVIIGEIKMKYDWEQINYLVSLNDKLTAYDYQYALDYLPRIGDYNHSVELYGLVCDKIKDIILSDDSPERLKKRIGRFKTVDAEFTKRLCRRCLELGDDSAVRYQLSYLETIKD